MSYHPFLISVLVCLPAMLCGQSAPNDRKSVYEAAIYFDFGKYDLRQGSDTTLAKVVEMVGNNPKRTVSITAHTDSIGSLENNRALSEKRADAVKSALVALGLPDSIFQTNYFGENMPAATNQSDEGRQKNRRATIEVVERFSKTILPSPTPSEILLEGTVVDAHTGTAIPATVVVHGKDFRDTLPTGPDGRFSKTFSEKKIVGVDAFASCYFFASEMVKLENQTNRVTLQLQPVKKGGAMDLDNLYFVGGQPILLENSKPELPKILRFMQASPDMKIEIAGHVNVPNQPPVAKDTQHFKLSENRARVVHDFLLKNGISAERISYKGYGNWEMRYPRAISERDQAQNRRVELRVVEGGCEK